MSSKISSGLLGGGSRRRTLRFESLEQRRLLAVVSVSNNLDIVNGATASIEALLNDDGGDGISLREAIEAANRTPGRDQINFNFGHPGPETIVLTNGELHITQALAIENEGPGLVSIDAQERSRIMRIDSFNDPSGVTLTELTLTGGRLVNDANFGGAILANNLYLFINDSVVEGNSTNGRTRPRSNFGNAFPEVMFMCCSTT
jgi:hypothetical protein